MYSIAGGFSRMVDKLLDLLELDDDRTHQDTQLVVHIEVA